MLRISLVCALALGSAGCFLPIRHTERSSPQVVGRLWQHDGTPAAGAPVAITTDPEDATCARARERTRTGTTGHFRLPATTVRRRWILVFPPFEHFANFYWLCAGRADTLLTMAYRGMVPVRSEITPRDSLDCLEWRWQDSIRVTCTGRHQEQALQSGGLWAEGADSGFYRLIVVPQEWGARQPGVFLQWVQRSEDAPEIVRETIALPLAQKLLEIEEARLWVQAGGKACVSVRSRGKPRAVLYWDYLRERVAVELGLLGQLHPVPRCAGTAPPA